MTEVSKDFVTASAIVYQAVKALNWTRASKFSPKKFTLAQVRSLHFIWHVARGVPAQILFDRFAELAGREEVSVWVAGKIMAAGRLSYRRLAQMLHESKSLRDALELNETPTYSTICKAFQSA